MLKYKGFFEGASREKVFASALRLSLYSSFCAFGFIVSVCVKVYKKQTANKIVFEVFNQFLNIGSTSENVSLSSQLHKAKVDN